MIITSELVRAARALLRWEQKDLAEASGVSLPSIKRLETQPGALAAQERTIEAIKSAIEDAGVEFTNGGQPGVRMKTANALTHFEFMHGVRLYEKERLPAKGVHVGNGQTEFGYSFEFPDDNNSVLLKWKGNEIGRANWNQGLVFFDPDFRPSGRTLNSMIDDWIARAQYHHTTGLPRTSGEAR